MIADPIRRLVDRQMPSELPEWEYSPRGWPADSSHSGWDSESVVSTQLARWPAFLHAVEAPAPLGMSGEAANPAELDYASHNTIMSFGYVLGRTAIGRSKLSMLDWGGGIGHYRVYAGALLPDIKLDYHCRDLSRSAAAGRVLLPDATFHDSDATALLRQYDLVIASSSLHYSKDWRGELKKLASVTGAYLYVTRQPIVGTVSSFVAVQRPHQYGYITEYPGWFLNRAEFLAAADELGLELLREFLIAERPVVPGAPEQSDYRGFLFAAPSGGGRS